MLLHFLCVVRYSAPLLLQVYYITPLFYSIFTAFSSTVAPVLFSFRFIWPDT